MPAPFTRLVRFEDPEGRIHYGEAGDQWEEELQGRSLRIFDGASSWPQDLTLSDTRATVAKVLCPLPSVPIVIGVGLNYRKHAEEAGVMTSCLSIDEDQGRKTNLSEQFPIPSFPVIFTKYADTLAGPCDRIPISKVVQELDYEGELCLVIGKDVKDLGESEDPLNFVLGYTVGNDISSRYWQNAQRSGGQHGYAKSFDSFAPIGPVIASKEAVGDPENLKLKTWVNGELRQDGATDDLIFDLRAILRHLSQGMTLKKGTVIMTGTPSGVAAFMKPAAWLQHNDLVEIEIEKIGKISNRMHFPA